MVKKLWKLLGSMLSKMENTELTDSEFKKKIFEYTNKELIERLKFLRTISETACISTEMTRRLIISIQKFNDNSSIQTNKIIKLTWGIVFLTIILGIITLIQII